MHSFESAGARFDSMLVIAACVLFVFWLRDYMALRMSPPRKAVRRALAYGIAIVVTALLIWTLAQRNRPGGSCQDDSIAANGSRVDRISVSHECCANLGKANWELQVDVGDGSPSRPDRLGFVFGNTLLRAVWV